MYGDLQGIAGRALQEIEGLEVQLIELDPSEEGGLHSDIPLHFKKNKVHGKSLLEIPSFMLIQRALEKGLQNRGIESVMNPESMDYDY